MATAWSSSIRGVVLLRNSFTLSSFLQAKINQGNGGGAQSFSLYIDACCRAGCNRWRRYLLVELFFVFSNSRFGERPQWCSFLQSFPLYLEGRRTSYSVEKKTKGAPTNKKRTHVPRSSPVTLKMAFSFLSLFLFFFKVLVLLIAWSR